MLGRLWLTYLTIGCTFGVWIRPVVTGFLFFNLRIAIWQWQLLDKLFYGSQLDAKNVKNPILIVGNPRTGTTFLHRFLGRNGFGDGMELWGSLYPSILLRKVIRPFLPIMEMVSPAKHHNKAAHNTNLTSVETDDVSLLFRFFDGFFLYGFFLAWAEDELKDMFAPEVRDTSDRDFDWIEKVWKRNLVHTGGDRVVAKLFSVGVRVPQFLERFPDARIMYTVRDPVDVIPSTFSLVEGVLEVAFKISKLPDEVRARYREKLYNALVELAKRFHDDWVSGKIDRNRVMVVTYPRMMKDFDGLMAELCPFVGVEPDADLQELIDETAAKQRAYESKHKYDLEKYGLSAERIRKDCAFVYETFLPELLEKEPEPVAEG